MNNLKKPSILYIGPIPPEVGGQSAGGVATHAWQLARQASRGGYKVYILANTTSSFIRDGIHVIPSQPKSKLMMVFVNTMGKKELFSPRLARHI